MTVKDEEKKHSNSDAFDHDVIRELANLLEETNLAEIEIEREGLRVRVARHHGPALPITVAAPVAATAAQGGDAGPETVLHSGAIISPMVGTAYLAPKPGDPPFVKEGDRVAEGQTLMIIEAMKTMNPIPAIKSGVVLKVLVPDGQPVEYGEPLLIIE